MLSLDIASSKSLGTILRFINLTLQTGKLRPRGGCTLPKFIWQVRREARCAGSAPRFHFGFGITPSSPSRAVLDSYAVVFTSGIAIRVTANLSLLRFPQSIFALANIPLT